MPVTPINDYIKVTFGGTAWAEQEIWSFGIHLAMSNGSSVIGLLENADLTPFITAFDTNLVSSTAPSLSEAVFFQEVRAAEFNIRGKQQGDSYVAFSTGSVYGQDTSPYLPQHSVVVTLNSDIPRGKTSKGRFYLPPGYGLPGDDGYVTNADLQIVANQVEGFLQDVQTAASAINPLLVIANISGYTPTYSGSANPVVGLSIGNVVDTQRRRRNGLKERYVQRAL